MLALLFFGLWNVAGYYRQREPRFEASVWAYGWPFTFLEREVQWSGFQYPRRMDDYLTWKLWSRAAKFLPGSLALNVTVAGLISTLLGAAFEVWRRRRAHLYQIYLSELGILTALVCGILGGGRYWILSARTEGEYLRTLPLRFEVESAVPEFIRERLPGYDFRPGDAVTAVSVSEQLSEGQMAIICRQRGLRKLEIHGPQAEIAWQQVVACRQLEELEIGQESLQDADLKLLARLPRLQKLSLNLGSVSTAGLRHVGRIKTLHELSLTEEFFSFVTTESLEQLSELPLTDLFLYFEESRCGECELTGVGNLKSLRTLSIRNKQLGAADVAALRKLVSLESLSAYQCEFESPEACESLFRTLTHLRGLEFQFEEVPASVCQAISELGQLEYLHMSGSNDFHQASTWVARINSLRKLDYYNYSNQSIDDGIARLVPLPKLEHLEFYCDGVTDKSIDSFVQMKSLKTLKLTCDHISPAGLKRLERERPELNVEIGMCY
jgi:hypothetical protein